MGPSNDFETIDIVPIEEGESYALRFIPKEVFPWGLQDMEWI